MWQEGALVPPLAHRPSVGRLERAGVKNRPNNVQKVLGTIPVLSDNKEKTRLAASSTPRYPQSLGTHTNTNTNTNTNININY